MTIIHHPQVGRNIRDFLITNGTTTLRDQQDTATIDWVGKNALVIGSGLVGRVAGQILEDYGTLLNRVYVSNGTYNPGPWQNAAGIMTDENGRQFIPEGARYFLILSSGIQNYIGASGRHPELWDKRVEGGLRIFNFEEPGACYNIKALNLNEQIARAEESSLRMACVTAWGSRILEHTRGLRALNTIEDMIDSGEVVYNSETFARALPNHPAGVEIGKYVRRRIDPVRYPPLLRGLVRTVDNLAALVLFKPGTDQAMSHFKYAVETSGNMFTSLTTIQLARQFLDQMKSLFPKEEWVKMITPINPKYITAEASEGRADTYFQNFLVVINGFKRDAI